MQHTAGRCAQQTERRSLRRWVCTSAFLPGLWTQYLAAPQSPDPPGDCTEKHRAFIQCASEMADEGPNFDEEEREIYKERNSFLVDVLVGFSI